MSCDWVRHHNCPCLTEQWASKLTVSQCNQRTNTQLHKFMRRSYKNDQSYSLFSPHVLVRKQISAHEIIYKKVSEPILRRSLLFGSEPVGRYRPSICVTRYGSTPRQLFSIVYFPSTDYRVSCMTDAALARLLLDRVFSSRWKQQTYEASYNNHILQV